MELHRDTMEDKYLVFVDSFMSDYVMERIAKNRPYFIKGEEAFFWLGWYTVFQNRQ